MKTIFGTLTRYKVISLDVAVKSKFVELVAEDHYGAKSTKVGSFYIPNDNFVGWTADCSDSGEGIFTKPLQIPAFFTDEPEEGKPPVVSEKLTKAEQLELIGKAIDAGHDVLKLLNSSLDLSAREKANPKKSTSAEAIQMDFANSATDEEFLAFRQASKTPGGAKAYLKAWNESK